MAEITLNKNNFRNEVLEHQGLVLVDFWAVAERKAGTVKVGKVNVDEALELAREYHIASIPTLILFKDGKPVKQSVGYISRNKIEKMWR